MVLGPPCPTPTPSHPHKVTGWLDCSILPVLDPDLALLIFSNSTMGQRPLKCDSNSMVGKQPLKCDSNSMVEQQPLKCNSNFTVGQQLKCDSNSTVGQQPLKCDDAHPQEILECYSTLQKQFSWRTENNELYNSSMIFEQVKITKQFSPHPPHMGQTQVATCPARLSPHAARVC